MKSIAIICFDFHATHIRSQPWHMAHGLAKGLKKESFNVKLFTDVEDVPDTDYPIQSVKALFHRSQPSSWLLNALNDYQPSSIFVFIGSHELLTPKRFHLLGAVQLVICNARFTLSELFRISASDYWAEWTLLIRPLLASLIPSWVLRYGFRKSGAENLVYVSVAAQQRYSNLGLPKGTVLIPAVDKEHYQVNYEHPKAVGAERVICYFGPPLQLRGVNLTIGAFEVAAEKERNLRLKLLLRLNGEPYTKAKFDNLSKKASQSKYSDRIEVVAKHMSASELKAELQHVDVFLLPFKLTVSDSPLVTIEAGLAGKPIVALKTPGVDEFIKIFGGVSVPNAGDLGEGILKALTINTRINDAEQWVDWSSSVKPLIDKLLHE
ncbi:MAG: hypothetical protein COB22_02320 [Cycloclasticus sp.]|nr:MAG: hypothetical protein COB22_02320 [Cycloclasticus sp.]